MKPSHMHYVLDEKGEPRAEPSTLAWADWMEKADRKVARTVIRSKVLGKITVSTVFLSLDHNWMGKGPPILWESMVFGGGPLDTDMRRCSGSREQAEALHMEMLAYVRDHLKSLKMKGKADGR